MNALLPPLIDVFGWPIVKMGIGQSEKKVHK